MPRQASQAKPATTRASQSKTQPTARRTNNREQGTSQVHEAKARQQASAKPTASNGRRAANRPETAIAFWPLDIVSVAYLAARDSDGKRDLDIIVCGKCAALLIESASSKKAHETFHRLIDGLDAAVAR